MANYPVRFPNGPRDPFYYPIVFGSPAEGEQSGQDGMGESSVTQNNDGSVTLTPEDARGIDALLAWANRRVADPGFFTHPDITRFAKEWAAARK